MLVVSINVINLWWIQRRGVIMAIGGSVMMIGTTAAIPSFILYMNKTYGW